jgi:hypothetical protein
MLSVPAPTPPPPPPPVRTDAKLEIEPDEQWKADLRKRIELSLRDMVEEAQTLRDTIFNSQPSESSRERAMVQYDKSMSEIRTLAQEEFTRQLRQEMSERKWALDVVDSNSPDVARQQQWILDNIHKAEEERIPFGPDGARRAAGALSSSPQQLGDGERVSDGSFENHFGEGFGSAGSEGEGDASDGPAESGEEDEEDSDDDDDDDEEEVHEEGSKPRQSRLPSRLNASLVHPPHSRSPVSRRGPPSRQRHPSNIQPPEEDYDEEEEDSHSHPPHRQGSQQYIASGAPARRPSSGSQGPYWRQPPPRAAEPSGISRTLAHANGQTYSTSPVQFPRRGSVNSTGSASSGVGLHRAGSMNSDLYRSGSVASHAPEWYRSSPGAESRSYRESPSARTADLCLGQSTRQAQPAELSYSITTADPRSAPSPTRRRDALPDVREPEFAGHIWPPTLARGRQAGHRDPAWSHDARRGSSWGLMGFKPPIAPLLWRLQFPPAPQQQGRFAADSGRRRLFGRIG